MRRLTKSASDAVLSDNLIIDYINRFWILDVDARIQLFDLKTIYQFQTIPNVDQYNMPLYTVQTEGSNPTTEISFYPVYQGFLGPATVNGIPIIFYTQPSQFFSLYFNVNQAFNVVAVGNGGSNYTIQLPVGIQITPGTNTPVSGILRGHVDMTGIIANGSAIDPILSTTINTAIPTTSIFPAVYFTSVAADGTNAVVSDSGQFLTGNFNSGLMMGQTSAPYGSIPLPGGYSTSLNTFNYTTGEANITFVDSSGNPLNIPAGQDINAQVTFLNPGRPRAALYYNNTLVLRSVPDISYLVTVEAFKTPAAFMNTTDVLPFAYMGEYIARGAARKILADTGDVEQFNFYEPLFREQEALVWKRSQRQWTATRTATIYSQGQGNQNFGNSTNIGTT